MDSISCGVSPYCRTVGFVLTHKAINGDIIKISNGRQTKDPETFVIHKSFPFMKNITLIGYNGRPTISGQKPIAFLFEERETHNFKLITLHIENIAFKGFGIARLSQVSPNTTVLFKNCHFQNITTNREIIRFEGHPYSGLVHFSDCYFINNVAQNFSSLVSITQNHTTFTNCSFINNLSTANGCLWIIGSVTVFRNSHFMRNFALRGGAIYMVSGKILPVTSLCEISGSHFAGNHAKHNGGAIYHSGGQLFVKGSLFDDNVACGEKGGAVYLHKSSGLSVSNCSFNKNGTSCQGGAIYCYNTTLRITSTLFRNNVASSESGRGGAIFATSVTPFTQHEWPSAEFFSSFSFPLCTISNSNFTENHAEYSGGAIYIFKTFLKLKTSVFEKNRAFGSFTGGGAICSKFFSIISISNSTFTDNMAKACGGAIDSYGKTLEIRTSLFENNNAVGVYMQGGGAISSVSRCTVTDSLFIKNRVKSALSSGGAIDSQSELKITASSFKGNVASGKFGKGGAVHSYGIYSFRISDTSFTGNIASGTNGEGGAMYLKTHVFLSLISNSTFKGNQAMSCGGAIYNSRGNLQIETSFFINNVAAGINGKGGAICSHEKYLFIYLLSIIYTCFESNKASQGGSVYNYKVKKIEIKESLFAKNIASYENGKGGAIYSHSCTDFIISDSYFKENEAKSSGGAVFNYQTKLKINSSKFELNIASSKNGNGGAIFSYSSSVLVVSYTSFKENQAMAHGGAICNEKTTLHIESSLFVTNSAAGAGTGNGGAVSVSSDSLSIISRCMFIGNKANFNGGALECYMSRRKGDLQVFNKEWGLLINESSFLNNTVSDKSGEGGALHLKCRYGDVGSINISSCTFKGSQAPFRGGAIMVDASKATIRNSSFLSLPHCHKKGYFGGEFIYSVSDITIEYVSFEDGDSCNSRNSLIIHDNKPNLNFSVLLKAGIHIKCFATKIIASYNQTIHFPGQFNYLTVFCSKCSHKSYIMSAGVIDSSLHDRSLSVANDKCHSCPLGAVCNAGKIQATDNFWGYISGSQVLFASCPFGYGCFGRECKNYSSCHAGRTGTLCGKCKNGLTENMLNSDCLAQSDCQNSWLWPLVAVAGLIYFIILMFLNEIAKAVNILLIPRSIIKQFKCIARQKFELSNTLSYISNFTKQNLIKTCELPYLTNDVEVEEIYIAETADPGENLSYNGMQQEAQESVPSTQHEEDRFLPGLFKVILFFYQTNALFKVYSGSKSRGSVHIVQELMSTMFNLRADGIFSQNFSWCPFGNLRPVTKVVLKSSFIIYLFTLLLFTFGLLKFGKLLNITRYLNREFNHSRLLCCTLRLILISYAGITSACFTLLSCIELPHLGNILFIDGSIQCYTIWQKFVISVVVFWILPFPVAIYGSSWLLHNDALSIKTSFLCLLFPLPTVCYCLYIRLWCHQKKKTEIRDLGFINQNDKEVLEIMEGPFRRSNCHGTSSDFRLPWESALIGRKLLLICIKTFVANTFVGVFLMLLSTVLFLAHHIYIKPFSSKSLNNIETVSLLMLTVIGLLNMPLAYNYVYPPHSYDDIQSIFRALKNTETILNLVFPFIVTLFVTILVCIRCFQLIFWSGRRFVRIIRRCYRCMKY